MAHVVVFTVGPTNAGKSTLMNVAAATPGVGVVEVGRMMRAKYMDPASPHFQPDFFKGEGAPAHTQAEAWQMMVDGIAANVAAGKRVTFVDGQPRDVQQADDIVAQYCASEHFDVFFEHLTCPESVREARRVARDGGDPEKDKLSSKRMTTDYRSLYHVFTRLQAHNQPVTVRDTNVAAYSPERVVTEYILYCDTMYPAAADASGVEPTSGYVAQG